MLDWQIETDYLNQCIDKFDIKNIVNTAHYMQKA